MGSVIIELGEKTSFIHFYRSQLLLVLTIVLVHFQNLLLVSGGGDRGAGARENRGREGYGRRERKGREAGVLRGRAAGEKCEMLIFLIQQCVRILSKTRTQNIRANYNAGLD